MPINIRCLTPNFQHGTGGNSVTAKRWGKFLKALGHKFEITSDPTPKSCDLLIALHARKNAVGIKRMAKQFPHVPIVVVLTGTDLYRDITGNQTAQHSLELATRLIVLQPFGVHAVPDEYQKKTVTILQSAKPPATFCKPLKHNFEVTVVGNLRSVKDPFRTAMASRLLPDASRIVVTHIGAALTPSMNTRANREELINRRYTWRGSLTQHLTLKAIARSRLLVVSSKMEGGANVISEAIIAGTPVLSTHISGSLGMLGKDYPGYFPIGDTAALAALLWQAETDTNLYKQLRDHCLKRAKMFHPDKERKSLKNLLTDLGLA
ncbi:MAG: TIGR04348 family glycosyltransferase [Planctomycetaceae bacterium]|jgi:putative glycosyltransferase (TIGR04348 family)|nr:TIGR04348 family glycosyltransferase [Planctomycetaceae bacterium]